MLSPPRVRKGSKRIPYGDVASPTGVVDNWYEDALLISQGNARRNGAYVSGGAFYCHKTEMSHGSERVSKFGAGDLSVRVRSLGAQGLYESYTVPPTVSRPSWDSVKGELSFLYPTGFKRARPGNPVASVGQFLAELRDLPTLPGKGFFRGPLSRGIPLSKVPVTLQSTLGQYRALGSEYLNLVFGWKPFVSDLRKMYYLWRTIDKQLAQLVKNNGKGVRRKATIEKDSQTSHHEETVNRPYYAVFGAPPLWMPGVTHYATITRTTTEAWFVGKFSYYVPDIGSSQWTRRATAALFGALPTPELLWEVLPWSWLVDWFSNVGDVISNASTNAVDNLTLKYSFVMKRVLTEAVCNAHVSHGEGSNVYPFYYRWDSCDHSFSSRFRSELKSRAGGLNPFGLGVQFGSLTNYQLGILGALGLSRGLVR